MDFYVCQYVGVYVSSYLCIAWEYTSALIYVCLRTCYFVFCSCFVICVCLFVYVDESGYCFMCQWVFSQVCVRFYVF